MLLDDFTADELNELIEIYSSEYGGILSAEEAFEEICCDALGRMNIFEGTDLNSESYEKAQDTVRKYAADKTGSKGRAPPKKGGEMYSREVNGKKIAWIKNNPLSLKDLTNYKKVAAYIANHIGEAYTILESGYRVYIGENLPKEYTQSEYTKALLRNNQPILRAKKKTIGSFGEMIEIATNRRWEKTKHAANKDAKYGVYRYSTAFAFPVKQSGKITSVKSFDAELVILNSSDGKKYLYDIVNIKENTADETDLMERDQRRQNAATRRGASENSIRSSSENVNEKFSREVKNAEEYFGTTYKVKEAGYICTDGKMLDFSGRHEGAPGGYRTVDHRDITDALGEDYGGEDYSGGMIKFMSEGNIRVSPESGGINLSVAPNKAQRSTLDRYISSFRGEVILDIDRTNGDTIASVEYPKYTHSSVVFKDIDDYFDKGKIPEKFSREPERLNELRRQNERKLAQATAEDAANENERGLDLKASLVFYVLCICRGCRFGIVRGRTLHADLQQQRSYKGRHYDHEDYRGEHRSGYEPGHAALLCNYQRDLAARYHAEADGDGVVGLEAGEPCTDAAADDLGDDGDEGQDNCEQNEVAVKPGKLGFYADGGKEYRGEEHITHRVYTLDYIGSRLAVVAEHDAGKVRAGYIGDAEEVLGNKAEQEAEGKRVDGYAPVDAVKPRAQSAKQLVHDDRHDGKEDKIRDDADKYHGRLNGGVREAREHGQNDDAEHVVNDGGGHDRCADAAFELAHLTQSLDRYRHRGSGQNDADERGLYHFKAVRLAVEQKITARTAEKRHDNADRGYDESRQPRMLELLEVRIEAGHEHEDDNADLGGLYEKVRFADEPEAARPEQQTRDQRAYDLRHLDLFARNAEHFC